MSTIADHTVLITGSTAGIGKETARALARLGARVLLVGRDRARADRARDELRTDTGNGRIDAFTADVTVVAHRRRLADEVAALTDRIDVLLNNAGVFPATRTLTEDGVEASFAAHALAPYALVRLLRPLLRPGARVVNLTGGIPGGPIDPTNLQGERRYLGWLFSQYNHSKTMTMAISRTLAAELARDDVTVNVCYPGHAYTPMNQRLPTSAYPRVYRPIVPLTKLVMPRLYGDVARASRSSVHLASSPELAGVTDTYVDQHCRSRPWPRTVTDPDVLTAVEDRCASLWNG